MDKRQPYRENDQVEIRQTISISGEILDDRWNPAVIVAVTPDMIFVRPEGAQMAFGLDPDDGRVRPRQEKRGGKRRPASLIRRYKMFLSLGMSRIEAARWAFANWKAERDAARERDANG